jgi:sec-independent protein translocase protein TatC
MIDSQNDSPNDRDDEPGPDDAGAAGEPWPLGSASDASAESAPEPAPESAPESAFDALPDPEPDIADAFADGAWPYTDRRPIAETAPDDRSPDEPHATDPSTTDETGADPSRGDMGFFDHLEELRSRIIKAILGLIGGAVIAAVYNDFIVNKILLRPAHDVGVKLQATQPMGQVTLALQVSLIAGLIISIPWIIWQFWQFVKPGLYPKERRYTSWIAVATIFCFLAGVAFAYFVMVPTSLKFASTWTYEGIENRWSISEYFSFVLGFILACGVVFEMPMLSFALARFGIVTPAFLRHYRRHAGVVILIVAAIITPTPDPFNQLVLAVPLYALFEISILVAAAASRKREEAYADMFDDEDIENIADKE